ncbi:hypothetical protein B0H14DRAFT_2654310 [Mycena olivaceomarginata]|nr:hypothetical protein B0H14DRAFT_2654310 [Mycena olivaceomarginata]
MQQMNRLSRSPSSPPKRLDEINLRHGVRCIDQEVYNGDLQVDYVIVNFGAIASVEGEWFSTILLHRFGLRLSADEGVQVPVGQKSFLHSREAREKGTAYDVTPRRFPSAAAATGTQSGTLEPLKRVLLSQMRSEVSIQKKQPRRVACYVYFVRFARLFARLALPLPQETRELLKSPDNLLEKHFPSSQASVQELLVHKIPYQRPSAHKMEATAYLTSRRTGAGGSRRFNDDNQLPISGLFAQQPYEPSDGFFVVRIIWLSDGMTFESVHSLSLLWVISSDEEEEPGCAAEDCAETGELEIIECSGLACGSKFHHYCLGFKKPGPSWFCDDECRKNAGGRVRKKPRI